MKRHISTFLIIIGIIVIAYPFIGKYIADKRQQEMLDAFYLQDEMASDASLADYNSLNDVFETTNTDEGQAALDEAVQSQDELNSESTDNTNNTTNTIQNSKTLKDKFKVLGVITIDKIKLKTPIAEGAELDILQFAVGHMRSTTPLGEIGNAVIAGHRSHSFGVYFNRLNELKIGDVIKIETVGKTFIYEVYEILLVEPDDVSVLRSSSEFRVLTLVTCDPVYNPTHRLIIHAVSKMGNE